MKTVKFNEMEDGDREDYELLLSLEKKYIAGTSKRIIKVLKGENYNNVEDKRIINLNKRRTYE